MIRPVIERRSSAKDTLNVKEITEKKFWDSLQLLGEKSHTSVVSETLLGLIQDSHRAMTPMAHYNNFEEKLSLILKNRLTSSKWEFDGWIPNERNVDDQVTIERARNNLKIELLNDIREALAVEYIHAIGGSEILNVDWNKSQSGKTLQESNAFDIALWLQTYCNKQNVDIYIPRNHLDKKNTVPRVTVVDVEVGKPKANDNNTPVKAQNNPSNKGGGSASKFRKDYNQPKRKAVDEGFPSNGAQAEKKAKKGCQKCLDAGKLNAAKSHETSEHVDGHISKVWSKDQREKEKEKNSKK